jgi:SAM-dependent methyltransferase
VWGADKASWFWRAVSVGLVANGVRLRRRVAALDVLDLGDVVEPGEPGEPGGPGDVGGGGRPGESAESGDPGGPGGPGGPGDGGPVPPYVVVTAAGVEVDAATARAARRHMRRHGLDALDLVPADLPSERVLDLVWLTDPATFRSSPLVRARGALSALVLSGDLAERLGIGAVAGLSPQEMLGLTVDAKRHAPLSSDLAVAPALRAAPGELDPAGRLACLEASLSVVTPMVLGASAVSVGLLAGGAVSRRPAALAAVAAHGLLPWIVARGTALAPRDLPGPVPGRLVAAGIGLAQMAVLRRRRPVDPSLDERRREYAAMLAGGVDALFEPRRASCPLCGSGRLRLEIEMPDLHQCKPGRFRIEACEDCGHLFQNPRLTPAGLDFYYRDAYDGAGAESAEIAFSAGLPSYRGRAELVAEATRAAGTGEPRRWLDVGAGHGHFCLLAQTYWPKATFDGLDIGDGIAQAERRGWVRRGWRGPFPAMAAELAGSYDVVSMHHYLEHTRDPGAELDAAAEVLEPGGHLLIELPDASSWLGRRLGRWWVPWLQPQHQHFLSIERLEAMLRDRGFTVVARQRSEPHQPAELTSGVQLVVNRVCPPVDVPWRPPSTDGERRRRSVAMAVATPLLVLALAADALLAPVLRRTGASNAFRVVARLSRAGGSV